MKRKSIGILLIAIAVLTACASQQQEEVSLPSQTVTETAAEPESTNVTVTAPDRPEESGVQGDIIDEQSFDVNLNHWGDVRFISAAPPLEQIGGDVTFYLMKDGDIVYTMPEFYAENHSGWAFSSVDAVAFKDVNQDGLEDVIAIISYITGAGAQGAIPFPTTRIFIANEAGFEADHELSEAIDEQQANQSINSILAYLSNDTVPESEPAGTDNMEAVVGFSEEQARTFMTRFVQAVTNDNREQAAAMIAYPKIIKQAEQEINISGPAELLEYYDEIFTDSFKIRLNELVNQDEEMFWNYRGAMLGNGELWIGELDGELAVTAVNGEQVSLISHNEVTANE